MRKNNNIVLLTGAVCALIAGGLMTGCNPNAGSSTTADKPTGAVAPADPKANTTQTMQPLDPKAARRAAAGGGAAPVAPPGPK